MKIQFAAIALIPLATIVALNSTVRAQTPPSSIWGGIYTEAQSNRGKDVYAQACASCHGGELSGGEMAPPLAGPDFMSGWDGLTVGDLYERSHASMPQNAPGSMTGDQTADVMAFMFAANKFPAGTTDMPKVAAVLKQIKIEAKKPA